MFIFQPDRHLLRMFVAQNANKFAGKVIDIGSNRGRYAHFFAHCEYKRLDPDPAVEPDYVASAEALPFADASVNGIICTQVLGDIWGVHAAIQEMSRILASGGLLLITESLLNEEHDEPHDYWRFTQFAWQRLLASSFDIEIMQPRGGYFSQNAQQHIRYCIEKYRLYDRPILGKIAHIWATIIGHWSLVRDRIDSSSVNKKFPIGYCILARRK